MSAPTTSTRAVRVVDVDLGGRRTVRITYAEATDDAVAELTLAAGFGGGDSGETFHRPAWAGLPLQLPGDALPALREALAALDSTTTTDPERT